MAQPGATTASTSISTRCSGSIRAATWAIVMAGRTAPSNSGVGAADGVGLLDVGHQVPDPHHVGKRSAHVAQRGFDSAQDEERLCVRVAAGDRLAVITRRGGAGNEYQVARAHGARIPVALLPWRA